jgi:protein TonB
MFFHVLILSAIALTGGERPPQYVPLAVMDFSDFDPFGGQGGVPLEELAPGEPDPEPLPPPPEPEPEFEPEPEPIFEPEDLTLLESLAEAAETSAPLITPPLPEEKPKPAEKPKPKPKPKPRTEPPPQTTGGGGGTNPDGVAGNVGVGGSGPGGTPGGTGTGNPDEMNAYKGKVRQRLERRKKYPNSAQSRGIAGTATVSFVIAKDGSVHGITLVKSSGHQILDDEAAALPQRCSPMPPLPKSYTGANLKLTVPIRFSVR